MPHPFRILRLPVATLFYFIVFSAKAQIFSSSVSASTGGSGRAAVEAGDAIFLNPATLVHLQGRVLHTSFVNNDSAISFSDNSPDSVVPAGFGYVQAEVPNSKFKQKDMSLTIGDFFFKKFSMGVTAHMYEATNEITTYNQTNAHVGFTFVPNENMGFGLVFYDVVGVKKEIPTYLQLQPRSALGFNYVYKSFARYRLDVESGDGNNWSNGKIMTGFESYLNQWLITRFGYYQLVKSDQGFATAGVGFAGPQFALNYAYQEQGEKTKEARHSIDLAIPF